MALKSNVLKAELQVSDFSRDYYETHALTWAATPSQSEGTAQSRAPAGTGREGDANGIARGASAAAEDAGVGV